MGLQREEFTERERYSDRTETEGAWSRRESHLGGRSIPKVGREEGDNDNHQPGPSSKVISLKRPFLTILTKYCHFLAPHPVWLPVLYLTISKVTLIIHLSVCIFHNQSINSF